MKYIKKFENIEEPELGDYVLIRENRDYTQPYNDFINNNIGQIVLTDFSFNKKRIEVRYYVDTFDEFKNMKNYFRYISFDFVSNEYYFSNWFKMNMVSEFGKTKEDVELKASTKKYNL